SSNQGSARRAAHASRVRDHDLRCRPHRRSAEDLARRNGPDSIVSHQRRVDANPHATRRERPDGSGRNSFPSGHAADTFAFATALERHLNWKYFVPAYVFSSDVAISRLPANRHWLSDAVFGSAVGIIAGAPSRVTKPK